MKLEKIIDQAKADHPDKIKSDVQAISVPCNIMGSLFPDVKIKKVFFQSLNPESNDSWRLYLVTDADEAIVLPVFPKCPIHLVTKQGMVDEYKEFIKLTAMQKENVGKVLANQEAQYTKLLSEIESKPGKSKKGKAKKKKTGKLKRVK